MSGHAATPAPAPSRVGTGPHKTIGKILIALALVGAVKFCRGLPDDPQTADANKPAPSYARVQEVPKEEYLKLRKECTTPCEENVTYRAQIWGDGPEFWITYPSGKEILYDKNGKYEAPEGEGSGNVKFRASDPEKPAVIRVYEKVWK
jgi:hypothetical protein